VNKIIEYSDVFHKDQIEEIWSEHLSQSGWSFGHTSNYDSDNYFWVMNLNDEKLFTEILFARINEMTGKQFTLKTVYANGQTFGLDGDFHIDDPDDNAYTFLYYPMPEWNLTWGGETVIINKDNTVSNIYPRPNTGILFPSNWIHYGKAPSRQCKELRVTIAFKFIE
jgi:hypothetical protein